MNRDEGSYTLSHTTYNRFLAMSHHWQEPEEELNKLLLTEVADRDRNVKSNQINLFVTHTIYKRKNVKK